MALERVRTSLHEVSAQSKRKFADLIVSIVRAVALPMRQTDLAAEVDHACPCQ